MSRTRSLALLGAGGLLLAVGAYVPEIALPGAWFATTFLLHGWRSLTTRSGLPCLAVALYAALAIANHGSIPVRGPLYFLLVASMTALSLIPFLLERWIGSRVCEGATILVFPMAFVALEFLRSRLPQGPGTWGSLAYTQYGNLPLMQLAAVTGIWGISFLIAWGASMASWAWEHGFAWGRVRTAVLTYAGLLAAILVAGGVHMSVAPPPTRTIRAVALTLPRDLLTPAEMFRIADGRIPASTVAARLERLHEWFFANTEREARAGAKLVAWPEMNFLVLADDEPAALDCLSSRPNSGGCRRRSASMAPIRVSWARSADEKRTF